MNAADWRSRVLEYVDDHTDDIVETLCALVRIPSVSGSEAENSIQSDLRARFSGIGLDIDHWRIPLADTVRAPDFPGVEVDRDEAWGLVATLPGRGDGRSLMFNSHVDVVPAGDLRAWGEIAPFAGSADGSSVYGRGACDMKGGLVAALWAVRTLATLKVPLRGDVLLACVQGEEDGGLGTYAMLQRGWRADSCVIPEPTSLDLAPGSCGSLTFRLRIPGRATHAARRSSGVSAVEKFWPVFRALRQLEAERNAVKHPLMSRWEIPVAIEIGVVHSGSWASSVPDELVADGRYGVALGESVDDARAVFVEAIRRACQSDDWLRHHPAEVEWRGGVFAPGLTALDSQVVADVRRAHTSVSTHAQQTWATPYGSDLRLMTNIGGVPTVHYGPGDAGVAHGPREFVPIDEVMTATRTLALAALYHCGSG